MPSRVAPSTSATPQSYDGLQTVALLGLGVGGVEHGLSLRAQTLVDLVEVLAHIRGLGFGDAATMGVTGELGRAVVDPALCAGAPGTGGSGLGLRDVCRVSLVEEGPEGFLKLLAVRFRKVNLPLHRIPRKADWLSSVRSVQIVGIDNLSSHVPTPSLGVWRSLYHSNQSFGPKPPGTPSVVVRAYRKLCTPR